MWHGARHAWTREGEWGGAFWGVASNRGQGAFRGGGARSRGGMRRGGVEGSGGAKHVARATCDHGGLRRGRVDCDAWCRIRISSSGGNACGAALARAACAPQCTQGRVQPPVDQRRLCREGKRVLGADSRIFRAEAKARRARSGRRPGGESTETEKPPLDEVKFHSHKR